MNRTKIEWTDYTWNPVTGCLNDCSYCYARKISHRFKRSFEPTFHPERLGEPYKVKKPSKIFVCSMGELFGPWVPREWQEAILKVAEENLQHTFQLLTKFPQGAWKFNGRNPEWPANAWLGATLNSGEDWSRLADLWSAPAPLIYISAEPLLGSLALMPTHLWMEIDWLIIGAQTNPSKQPRAEWVEVLLAKADYYGFPVFMKDNLKPGWPGVLRREFPQYEKMS